MTVPVGLIARIERVLTERAIHAYRGKTRFSMEGLEDIGTVMGEAIPGPGPHSFSTRKISWDSEDDLQEEDHLGKQSFVPKAILHW